MRRALLILQGQVDWKQEVRRPLVLGRLVLVWVPALVLLRLVRQLELALVLRLVLVLQLAWAPLAPVLQLA